MTERDQRFQELDQLLTRGGARDEDEPNSGREDEDGIHTSGNLPTLSVGVEATGDFVESSSVNIGY